jgi:hypothetical protein
MAQAASIAAGKVVALFTDAVAGLAPVAAQIAVNAGVDLPSIPVDNVLPQNTPVALMEKSAARKDPVGRVYKERVQKRMTEK